jgi:hypothetical protein
MEAGSVGVACGRLIWHNTNEFSGWRKILFCPAPAGAIGVFHPKISSWFKIDRFASVKVQASLQTDQFVTYGAVHDGLVMLNAKRYQRVRCCKRPRSCYLQRILR